VAFYYIYKPLAHPEFNSYVVPFTLEERLMHVAEAKRTLGSRIPWLADTMDNSVHTAFGGVPNGELVIDPEGLIVAKRGWSDPAGLREDLARIVGPIDKLTKVTDLDMPTAPPPDDVARGIVPRIELPKGMWPLIVEPAIEGTDTPFYVKLRAEGDPALLSSGSGKLYLGFHLDRLHKVHWNNEAPPVEFSITSSAGISVKPGNGVGPTPEQKADADPREFLIDVVADGADKSVGVDVKYYACDDALTFCVPVKQRYTVHFRQNKSHGWSMRTPARGS